MSIEAVRRSVEVAAPVDRAFDVFVDRIGDWWPARHAIGVVPKATARMERGQGGRVLEIGTDGSECQWGTILTWEPPHRLVIAWQITARWSAEPDLSRASEYEVRFVALDEARTRVHLEHRHLDRHGDGGGSMRAAVDGPDGWSGVLAHFARLASH